MEEIKTGVFKVSSEKPIYIIGDLHGDYQCMIHCLTDLCGVTYINSIEPDEKFNETQREILEWIPNNNSIVVFCGDLIHRKRFQDTILDDECSDIFIIKTLFRLKKNAQKYSGDIVIISGNHEIMNILDPSDSMYTSDKNIKTNFRYFSKPSFVNKYISETYAWIKINDILIAHGGLCSDYLKFLDNENELRKKRTGMVGGFSDETQIKPKTKTKSKTQAKCLNCLTNTIGKNIMIGGDVIELGDDIVQFVNNKYREFFTDYNNDKSKTDPIGYKLFKEYDFKNKHNHNMFWCREWGYSGVNCNNFSEIVSKVGCNKMIISHCPQFMSPDKPKMINFECEEIIYSTDGTTQNNRYKIARVDLGMSRSFDNNRPDEFVSFLANNYNRKISVLKLSWDSSTSSYYFNYDSVITEKLSCIQYLLMKYGLKKKEWEEKNIQSNWLGFNYINSLTSQLENKEKLSKCTDTGDVPNDVVLCLLYPLYYSRPQLNSVNQFTDLVNKKK